MDLWDLAHWSEVSSSYLLALACITLEWSKWQHSQPAQHNQCNRTELFKRTERLANLGH